MPSNKILGKEHGISWSISNFQIHTCLHSARYNTVRNILTVLIHKWLLKICFLLSKMPQTRGHQFFMKSSKSTEVHVSFITFFFFLNRIKIDKTFTSERCNASFRPAFFASERGSKKSWPRPALKTKTHHHSTSCSTELL